MHVHDELSTELRTEKRARIRARLRRNRVVGGAIAVAVATGVLVATIGSASADPSAGDWQKLRNCESGGNYAINTGNGYYGAYQFDLGTWRSVGGSGMPNEASPATQDAMAYRLWQERGWSPWTCASIVGLPAGGSGGPAKPAAVAKKVTPAKPTGHLDSVKYNAATGRLVVTGWAADLNFSSVTSTVKVTIDGNTTVANASTARADVNRAMKLSGAHGFVVTAPASADRVHRVCVTIAARGTGPAVSLHCMTASVPHLVRASTTLRSSAGRLVVAGWTFDNAIPNRTTSLVVTVNGVKHTIKAGQRSDDPFVLFRASQNHGLKATLPLHKGGNRVCVVAMGSDAAHTHTVGCRIVNG